MASPAAIIKVGVTKQAELPTCKLRSQERGDVLVRFRMDM